MVDANRPMGFSWATQNLKMGVWRGLTLLNLANGFYNIFQTLPFFVLEKERTVAVSLLCMLGQFRRHARYVVL